MFSTSFLCHFFASCLIMSKQIYKSPMKNGAAAIKYPQSKVLSVRLESLVNNDFLLD